MTKLDNRIEEVKRICLRDRRDYITRLPDSHQHPMLRRFGERYAKYRADWDKSGRGEYLPSFPIHIDFGVVDFCNLKCIMCFRITQKGSKARLSFVRFKVVIDEGIENGLRAIGFGWGDEPFLNKDILRMASYASSKGIIDIRVHTNATLLNSSMAEDIIDSGITYLSFSLDATTPETYKHIRGGNLERIEAEVNGFLSLLKRKGKVLPQTKVSFVVMPCNIKEVDPFVEKWIEKVDLILLQNYYAYHKLGEKATKRRIPKGFFCYQPWQRVSVTVQGDILPCCNITANKLGNIGIDSIKECWDSDIMNNLRNEITTGDLSEMCIDCYSSWANAYLECEGGKAREK